MSITANQRVKLRYFTHKQRAIVESLHFAHLASHEWVLIGNSTYPMPSMKTLEKRGTVEIQDGYARLTSAGTLQALQLDSLKKEG